MMIGKIHNLIKKNMSFLISFLLLLPVKAFAIALSIIPLGVLPQAVTSGSTVTAAYSVINNSGSIRFNNYVKSLPPNVKLGAGGCGSTFTLAPAGSPGSRCTLNLIVSGAVNGADPNINNHLFICFPGGKSCIGTDFPLNVTQSAVPPVVLVSVAVTTLGNSMLIGRNQQLAAMGTYSNGTTSDISSTVTWTSSTPATVSISNSGVATALTTGSATVTAKSGSITSPTVGLTVNSYAYLSSNPTIYLCTPSSGLLTNCNANPDAIGVFWFTMNVAHTYAYVTLTGSSYRVCPVNLDGTITSCVTESMILTRLLLNSANGFAYTLLDSYPSSQVSVCSADQNTGILGNCTTYGVVTFDSPVNATFNAAGTFFYVSEYDPIVTLKAITICQVNPTTGLLTNCGNTSLTFFPYGIALNGPGNFLYVADATNTAPLNICTVNSGTGAISNCVAASGQSFNSAKNISFDTAGTHMYVTEGNTLWVCTPNSINGSYSGCVSATTGLTLANTGNVTFTS
jgi:hypothetical protein